MTSLAQFASKSKNFVVARLKMILVLGWNFNGLIFKLWMNGKVAPKEDCNHWEMEKLASDPNIFMIFWRTNIQRFNKQILLWFADWQIFKYSTNKYFCRPIRFHMNHRPDMQNIVCGHKTWEKSSNVSIFSSLFKEQRS